MLGETLEAARLGRRGRRGRLRAAARRWSPSREAIAAESFQGARPDHGARRRRRPALAAPRHVFEGEFEFAGQEHFYLETHASLATIDEAGQVFVQSQHPAPDARPRRSSRTSSACTSHEVTVQCLRMGGGFGGKEMQPHGFAAVAALGASAHRPAGPAAAEPARRT